MNSFETAVVFFSANIMLIFVWSALYKFTKLIEHISYIFITFDTWCAHHIHQFDEMYDLAVMARTSICFTCIHFDCVHLLPFTYVFFPQPLKFGIAGAVIECFFWKKKKRKCRLWAMVSFNHCTYKLTWRVCVLRILVLFRYIWRVSLSFRAC